MCCPVNVGSPGPSSTRSGPLYRPGPNSDLMLMGWRTKPDPDSPFGPGDGLSWHQFLDAVLPKDPRLHPRRDGWGADRELAHLLRLQAPGLP